MRTLWLLMALTSIGAYAQTPQELLHLAQDVYKNPSGYLIEGKGVVRPAGSSWQVKFTVRLIGTPASPETPNAPVGLGVQVGGPMNYTKTGEGDDEKPSSFSMPLAVTGRWDKIAENVISVKEVGSEQLLLNGAPVDCRVLEVEYNPRPDTPKPTPVKYSICSDKYLVLKKVMFYSTGHYPTDAGAVWTVTFDKAQFPGPTPK